jgi:hypothetical protein
MSSTAFSQDAIRAMVADWYRALDRHDNLISVLPYLAAEGLEMRFPEGISKGQAGFTDWYNTVTRRFFDEVHTVNRVDIADHTDTSAELEVVVNWQARIWNPPAPKSEWLGFDAYQLWTVIAGPDGQPQIVTYIVNSLDPMPGSAAL